MLQYSYTHRQLLNIYVLRLTNLSFVNSQQAKAMFHFKNIKENLYKSLPDARLVRPKTCTCRSWWSM